MALQTKTFVFAVSLAVLALGQTYAQETDLPPSGDEVVLGEEDLGERGEVLRNMYRRITPPAMETLVQDVGTVPAAWEEFGPQWDDAAAARKFGTWVVPVALTQVEGATILSDANGRILWRGTNDFARPESSGVVLTGGLVAEGDWPAYEAVREELASRTAAVATSEDERQNGAWFGDRSSPATNGLRFASVAVETNGEVRLGLAWEEEDGEVDIFAYAVAHTSSWVVATWTNDENAVVASTNLVWTPVGAELSGMNSAWEWVGTVAVSNGVAEFTDSGFPAGEGRMRYYAAMHATDTDNDDLNDGWEHFVTHTDPINPDSDNDLLFDGEEVAANLDPNDPDMDGDGLLDGWEVRNGLDPLDPDGANGPDGDPDGDGFPNSLEYALGGFAQGAAWSSDQLAYRLRHLQNGDTEPGLRVDIEDALNCGGTNDERQNVAATLDVPDLMDWGVFLDVTVQGKVEDQNQNYDWVSIEAITNTILFKGNENHNGCSMATKTATCRILVLPNSQVKLRYDTRGHKYHQGAYAAITGVAPVGFIKSTTYSTHPPNVWRTELGVGEQFFLEAPWFMGDAVWYRNGESTPVGTGTFVDLTAPEEGGTMELSVTFDGHVVSRTFHIREPAGVVSAKIRTNDSFEVGSPGAGMRLYPVVVGPTNVSFYKVQIKEVGSAATNCTGWWVTNTPPPHDLVAGADRWIPLDAENAWRDHAAWSMPVPPGASGHFEWPIPARWRVGNNGTEQDMTGWLQEIDLDTNGTVTIRKFGKWVTRTIDGTTTHN